MSLHEKQMNGAAVEKPQSTADRLYPSLPNIHRCDFSVADPARAERLRAAAVKHPDSVQSEAASSDVRMKSQILILEEQREELLSINEKWAKEYHTMVQYYKEKVRDLKALLQQDHFKEETSEDVTLHKKEQENTWTGYELFKAEEEKKELREQNSTLTRKGQHQREEIRRLNKALEEALTTQPLDVSRETLHDVWKHQAEVYKEDFLKERRDREKLKEKYLEQEKKFRKVHNELCVLKSQVTRTRMPQPAVECTCTNPAANWEVR